MTSVTVKQLYNCVPGFKDDKDEWWAYYLPKEDAKFLKTARRQFVVLNDNLDELKSNIKGSVGNSQRQAELKEEIKCLTKQIDGYISSIISKITNLKAKGTKERDERIARDMAADGARQSSVADPSIVIDSEMTDDFNILAFMPRPQVIQTAPTVTSEQGPSTEDQDQMDHEMSDEYLDGVTENNLEIMEKMREKVERFRCKDLVLQTLERFRERETRLDLIGSLRSLDSRNRGALVAVNNKG